MHNPKVTIIIPAYNAEFWIVRCITSCLNQNYDNLEIIVINDGSTDHTMKILMGFVDARLIIYNINNVGASEARKIGIEKSSGEYIYFVDSDDYIDINAISLLVNEAVRSNADMVISQARFIKKTGSGMTSFKMMTDPIKSYLNGALPTTVWPILFKKDLIETNYIQSPYVVSEDYVIMSKIYTLPIKIILINECLYNYVRHGSSSTSNLDIRKYEDNFNAHHYIEDDTFKQLDEKYRIDRGVLNLNFLYNLIVIKSPFANDQLKYIKENFSSNEIREAKQTLGARKKIIILLNSRIILLPVLKVLLLLMKNIRKFRER